MSDGGRVAAAGPVPWIVPALLIMASAVGVLATDIYSPSLPHLPAYFSTDAASVQLTMSLHIIAYALAQLGHGPLSDRFGRRPVLLAGVAAFVVFSLAAAGAGSIETLIAARILQGIAASAEAVVVLAVIRDLYDQAGAVRILGIYGMTLAMAPAAGPVIGGYVHVALGWRANFLILAGLAAAVTVLVWRYLPETTAPDRGALRLRPLGRQYLGLLLNRRYIAYVAVMSASVSGIFAFVTAGPFILIDRLGVRTEHFGFYQAVIVLTFFIGSLVANRGVGRIGIEALLRTGLAVAAAGALSLPALLAAGLESAAGVTAAMALYALGLGLVFATGPVRVLDMATGGRGVAAALLGTVQMLGGAFGALAVGFFHDGSAWPLAVTVSVVTTLAACVYTAAAPWRKAGVSR